MFQVFPVRNAPRILPEAHQFLAVLSETLLFAANSLTEMKSISAKIFDKSCPKIQNLADIGKKINKTPSVYQTYSDIWNGSAKFVGRLHRLTFPHCSIAPTSVHFEAFVGYQERSGSMSSRCLPTSLAIRPSAWCWGGILRTNFENETSLLKHRVLHVSPENGISRQAGSSLSIR